MDIDNQGFVGLGLGGPQDLYKALSQTLQLKGPSSQLLTQRPTAWLKKNILFHRTGHGESPQVGKGPSTRNWIRTLTSTHPARPLS
jgi:hypothetical protein